MNGSPEQPTALVPDALLDFDENLVCTYEGERFTGVGYKDVPGYAVSEISHVDGLQEGPAREWYPSGQLKAETMLHA
jgi:antitoxin component YwqK of YwqJK toxin-antitoxin module